VFNRQELGRTEFCSSNSSESLRLQPPVPGGSQRSVNKGAGEKVLGKWYADTSVDLVVSDNGIHFSGSSQRKLKSAFTSIAFNGTREISILLKHSCQNDGSAPVHLRGSTTQLRSSLSHMDLRTVRARILR
jgi:hypothetical protein